MPRRERIVVVGASVAGLRAAECLRAEGFTGELVIVGREPHPPYSRPPLSKRYLTDDLADDEVALPAFVDLDARWILGTAATALDPARRQVSLDDPATGPLAYDGLVIATGATPRRSPAIPELPGVHLLRTLDDARRLRAAFTARPRHVLVVGGGFVGSEVASTARHLDLDVTMVDLAPLPLSGPLGSHVAGWLADQHRAHGIATRFGDRVVSMDGGAGPLRAGLAGGDSLTADVVVVGLGAVPNTAWLQGSGLVVDDGVHTDAALFATGAEDIVVAGDVGRSPHPLAGGPTRIEHWSHAVDSARVAAANLLAGRTEATAFSTVPAFWTGQHGHKIQSVGLPHIATGSTLLRGSPDEDRFVVGFGRDGVLVGAVAVNLPSALPPLRRSIAEGAPCAVPESPTPPR